MLPLHHRVQVYIHILYIYCGTKKEKEEGFVGLSSLSAKLRFFSLFSFFPPHTILFIRKKDRDDGGGELFPLDGVHFYF